MKLTPLEIKQQQFEKTLRGYDVAEVQSFLTLVSNEVEHLLNKNKELEEQIEKLTDRVKHYERVEEALHETLQTTKESVAQKIDNAKLEAQNKIDKAEMEAEAIIKEANYQRQQIRQNILRLLDKREEIIAGISAYLNNAQNSLEQFTKDDLKTYALPKEEEVKEDTASIRSRFELDVDLENTGEEPSDNEGDSQTDESDNVKGGKNLAYPPGSDRLDDILDEID